jgi:hypothetical protein
MSKVNVLSVGVLLLWILGSGCSNDNCVFALDGQCDDSAYADAMTEVCDTGTDTTDCNASCEATCPWDGDGQCDDGGEGSDTAVCSLGTDCTDCGTR